MRVAALYDIHGHLPTFEAVLVDVEQARVDRIVIGGDVAPGPLPVETLERLPALGDHAALLRGNGDRWVVEALNALAPGSGEHQLPRRPWATWSARAIARFSPGRHAVV
jgi:Icc-related predicted phosphoesterase